MNPSGQTFEAVPPIAEVLACPVTRAPLVWDGDGFVEPVAGRRYPVVDGVIELVAPEEREFDLGDRGHYEQHPFEYVALQDPLALGGVVEPELREFVAGTPHEALIADVGCGPGRVSIWLSGLDRNIVGVDYSWASLRRLRPHVAHPLLHGNNLRLPLADAVLDAVVSTGVVHHTRNPLLALRENCRVLRPGGRMYLRALRAGSYYDLLYHSVGSGMRGLRRQGGRPGRWFVDSALFGVYRAASRVLKPGRSRDRQHLRSLFENYFLKDLVQPLRRDSIEHTLTRAGMEIEAYSPTAQMHCYVVRKRRDPV